MREKGTGTFMFISSIGAWSHQLSSGAYSASKATLECMKSSAQFSISHVLIEGYMRHIIAVFVELLAQELAIVSPGIEAFLVEAGFFRTKVFQKLHAVKPCCQTMLA